MLFAVDDLSAAAEELESRHGLASVEGGLHPDWGTANRIVPLGQTYLELVTVVDDARATASSFGRWIARESAAASRPVAWAVRTSDIDAVAGRLGLSVLAGSRLASDGRSVRWRCSGISEAAAEPLLPFFLQWDEGTPFPGRVPVRHPAGVAGISKLALEGQRRRLDYWLGPHELPVDVRPGGPRVVAVVVAAAEREIVLGAD